MSESAEDTARRELRQAGAALADADAQRQRAMEQLREAVRGAAGLLPIAQIAALGGVTRPTVYKILEAE